MLPDMIEHFKDNRSLLAKIYGCYTIKTNVFEPVDILVMQNTAKVESKENEKMTFDLKGSLKNRKVGFEEKWWTDGKKKDCKTCMKDLNFIEINKDLNQSLIDFPE